MNEGFIINEDGSVTRTGTTSFQQATAQKDYTFRPAVLKFYTSTDSAKCGDTIRVAWAIQDAESVNITLRQGGCQTSETFPSEGEITIQSNISSDDIDITISAQNNIGVVSRRKTIAMSKRENTVLANVGATIVWVIIGLLIGGAVVAKLIEILLSVIS